METRLNFCEKEFAGRNKNSENCLNNFCDMCCVLSQSKNAGECKNKCDKATVKQKISPTEMEKCAKLIPNQTDDFNLEGCKNCCNTFNESM